ncbi:MAG: hypothetical protein QGG40_14845 [Myxococcota bacterium]|jgi:hypothetical protein|nr:hypothetical protein [Myxococcota bacterium]
MRLLLPLLLACGDSPSDSVVPWTDATCEQLFGEPGENTGLDESQCVPLIETTDERTWTPREWSEAEFESLADFTLDNPPEPLGVDPYGDPDEDKSSGDPVCGALLDGSSYRLETYEDETAALQAGARITHGGACGACSSLADLKVYAQVQDLTTPVRACALENLGGDAEENIACLEELGFTGACAEIWHYNTQNTSDACLEVCLSAFGQTYHTEDGTLNECIQCDEDMSGPVFKAVAGRTRRNSGLATALCRPCETVWRIEHDYQ